MRCCGSLNLVMTADDKFLAVPFLVAWNLEYMQDFVDLVYAEVTSGFGSVGYSWLLYHSG